MATQRVLVVDDECSVLGLVSAALSSRGYEVHAADSPIKALELVVASPCFDLVLSDVIMPEMSGPELVRRLAPLCPNAAIVLMSGHIAGESLPKNVAFIRKPFALKDLYSIVESKLAGIISHTP